MRAWAWTFIALVTLAAGCANSSGSSDTCDEITQEFSSCGGDIRGVWQIRHSCLASVKPNHILFVACPSASITAEVETAGTLRIDDSHFRPEFDHLDLIMHLRIPLVCLATLSLDCAYVETELNADPGTSASCQVEAATCACDAVQDLSRVWTGSLPYSQVSDSELLVEDPDGDDYRIPYCVEKRDAMVRVDFHTDTGSAEVYFQGRLSK